MGVGEGVPMNAAPGFEGPSGRRIFGPPGCGAPFRRGMRGSYIPQLNEKPGKIQFKGRAPGKNQGESSLWKMIHYMIILARAT